MKRMRMLIFCAVYAFVASMSFLGCAKVWINGEDRGRITSTMVRFVNENDVQSHISYLITVSDARGSYHVVIIEPGQASPAIRVPIGRATIAYEIYKGRKRITYPRTEIMLFTPPLNDPDGVRDIKVIEKGAWR